MFGSKSLKCLVCQRMVEEFEHKISSVDRNKKIAAGTFRIDANGEKTEKVVSGCWPRVRIPTGLVERANMKT